MSDRSDRDRAFMQQCLTLAAQAAGQTAPNPLVGAVIVKGDQVVGQGYHPQAGQPHAEVFALREAGVAAQGATLYVNLEPCNHTGRTPPCTEAILAAGISRVVVGMVDPDPRVSGGGIERLRQNNVQVTVGVETEACGQLNEAFVHRIKYQRPFGILKYAMTLDGKIATRTGHSAWVTGPVARREVHRLRNRCDAVIVGGNTVRQDDPHLTPHGQGNHPPLRVVMSRQLNLPETAHLWDQREAPTVVFCGPQADTKIRQHLEKQGVEVVCLATLTPQAVLEDLYQRGHLTVLWECGGQLAAAAIAQHCVQKVWAFVAPKIIGGTQAPSPVGELGLEEMNRAIALEQFKLVTCGPDFLITGYLPPQSKPSIDSDK
ncbi:MAG: bifunctional diaminohydroxyphosphoribosylaminopyrimidine deaminase/5-amino-6-(5-phosphoribosylamino)uracil reductase RibD [Cyanobacteria bacterium]|nr:bifunctional diaminohydroxyphosphoribosylaminopyrimidine deaminase/5-amino-6-(5-phosphoribosylamino)uracil reductase RibD [Cyanobacteriota bacterium]MDA0866573.1 bifunctional diaminohydroxyphosphoribosylaminopyrimidine deaminase/5-amino-6-(5-phosphoribosylamino)uracil reductase RibD [Cyanobacteriota bacterium]